MKFIMEEGGNTILRYKGLNPRKIRSVIKVSKQWTRNLINNKQIRRIDISRRNGLVDWWEVNKFRERGVCELYIKVYPPIKFHADIFCSHWDMFHTKFKHENKRALRALGRSPEEKVTVEPFTEDH